LATAVSSISSAHAGARFDNPHLATWVTIFEGIALAREAIDAERVIVVGPAGCGKTSLACAIGHAIIDRATAPDATVEDWKRAEGLRFFDAFDIANARQQSGRGDEAPVVREALRATVLILDDLGAEDHRLFGTAVEEVIHKRHRMIGVTTIVTTGFPEQRLAEIYGAGIARRLFEDAILIE
jgi:DNA replication protein DnaC